MQGNKENQLEVVSVRLVKDTPLLSSHKIHNPEDEIAVVGELLCELDREVVCIINLKADGTPINCHFASMGAINESIVSPREIFKSSILSNAAGIIMIHNHPSGNLYPSQLDTAVTEKMLKLCLLMGIPLQDPTTLCLKAMIKTERPDLQVCGEYLTEMESPLNVMWRAMTRIMVLML